MTEPEKPSLPPDDPSRRLTHVHPDSPDLPHIAMVGDTYTILVSGADTAGHVEQVYRRVREAILEGEIVMTFRGEQVTVRAGETINVPANAPHFFKNASEGQVRLLCMCSPAGQDEFFAAIGKAVPARTTPAPKLTDDEMKAFGEKAQALAPKYRTEILEP